MKQVLLIGDSIRQGYCSYVKENLESIAEVYYPEDNCRNTQYTLVSISNWISLVNPQKVKVVHWNNGQWDVAHWRGEEISLNSPEEYAVMLERIYKQLQNCFPNAKIIFALTTPMNPNGCQGINPRTNSEIDKYNFIACGVMNRLNVQINDLYTLMKDKTPEFYKDYVHFTEEGYKIIADKVTDIIKRNLEG